MNNNKPRLTTKILHAMHEAISHELAGWCEDHELAEEVDSEDLERGLQWIRHTLVGRKRKKAGAS